MAGFFYSWCLVKRARVDRIFPHAIASGDLDLLTNAASAGNFPRQPSLFLEQNRLIRVIELKVRPCQKTQSL